jgi:hypothetical protein
MIIVGPLIQHTYIIKQTDHGRLLIISMQGLTARTANILGRGLIIGGLEDQLTVREQADIGGRLTCYI